MAAFKSKPQVSVIDAVSLLSKWPFLLDATCDSTTPTSGYMLQEINKITFTSGGYNGALVDFLADNLQLPSCQVKLKVLLLMKYITDKGHANFRRVLRRKAAGIAEAMKVGGPSHPIHGMEQYLAIRTEARKLLEILFDERDDEEAGSCRLLHHDITTEQASQPHASIAATGMGSSSKGASQGFGNTTTTTPKSITESVVSGFKGLAGKVLDEPTHHQIQEVPSGGMFGNYTPVEVHNSVAATEMASPESTITVLNAIPKRGRRKGVAGGGWEDEEEEGSNEQTPPNSNSADGLIDPNLNPNCSSAALECRLDGLKVEELSGEQQLVDEAVMGSRSTVILRREQQSFLKSCSKMNADRMVACINERLLLADLVALHRSLVLLEVLLHSDLVDADLITTVCSHHLFNLFTQSTHSQLQQKARKILRILEKRSKQEHCFTTLNNVSPPTETASSQTSYEAASFHQVSGVVDNNEYHHTESFERDRLPALVQPLADNQPGDSELSCGRMLSSVKQNLPGVNFESAYTFIK